jgi:hypothetical protein
LNPGKEERITRTEIVKSPSQDFAGLSVLLSALLSDFDSFFDPVAPLDELSEFEPEAAPSAFEPDWPAFL